MLSRNLEKAKKAYRSRDPDGSRAAHDHEDMETHRDGGGRYLKSSIYGGLDGIITTFAVVAGVTGASLEAGIVLILGFANLIADGLAMAFGEFLSGKAEREFHAAERERETWEFENHPEGEKQELMEIYVEKGLSEEDARQVVDVFAKKKDVIVDVMMIEELGLFEDDSSPVGNAFATFLSFVMFGFVPLLSYVATEWMGLGWKQFHLACGLTALTLFSLGALKVRFTNRSWLGSGLEMMLIGGIAALAAFGIGHGLSDLAN